MYKGGVRTVSAVLGFLAGLGSIFSNMFEFLEAVLKYFFVGLNTFVLTGLFDNFNNNVNAISTLVSQTPQEYNGSIFSFVQTVSENAIMPCAVIVLAIVMSYELIMMIIDKNNMNEVAIADLYKWCFKTTCAILLVECSFDIVNAIFEMARDVVMLANVSIGSELTTGTDITNEMIAELDNMELVDVMGTFFLSLILWIVVWILTLKIHFSVIMRMFEVYMMISFAPIPFATLGNREWGQVGQNYIKAIFGLAFQSLFYMLSLYIYGILLNEVTFDGDLYLSMCMVTGYAGLLCFTIDKVGSYSNRVFGTS